MKTIIVKSYSGLAKAINQAKRDGYKIQNEISGRYYLMQKQNAESIQIVKG